MIHPDKQVPTAENVCNLRQRGNQQIDYTHRYGFQATIIHYALTQISMKRGPNKFKLKGEKAVTSEIAKLHKRNAFRTVCTYDIPEEQKQ